MKWLCVIFCVFCLVPEYLPANVVPESSATHATTWQPVNTKVDARVSEIKYVLFGPVVKILGALGVCYGVVKAFSGQYKPLLVYGGLGILLNILPSVIDVVFGAMLA